MLVLLVPYTTIKVKVLYAALTATLFVNQAYVLYWLNYYANAGLNYAPNLTGDPIVLAVSVINLVMFLYATVLLWGELRGRQLLKTAKPNGEVPK
jgi:uncharacterized membrane protein